MKKKLVLLNFALIALTVAIGWQLRVRWTEARLREVRIRAEQMKPVPAPPMPKLEPVTAVNPAIYAPVAQNLLFARDRNPNVEIEVVVVKEKPMPPLPTAHGFMGLGEPTVILIEKAGAPQRSYRAGDQVGDFKLLAVDSTEVTFEWEGKRITKPLEELLQMGLKAQGESTPPPQVAAAAPPPVGGSTLVKGSSSSSTDSGPGVPMDESGSTRACQNGDKSPAGTVLNGMKKVLMSSPFGTKCWWEPAK